MRIKNKSIINFTVNHLYSYPTSLTLNYNWSFGSILGVCLGFQILTGIVLAMFYVSSTSDAFFIVNRIMKDINDGWLIRYAHSNGASLMFVFLYLHMAKAILYKTYNFSFSKLLVWYSGLVIYLLCMATAFLGYVLPWGQMSYWAATVITNLFTVIPYVGDSVSYLLWGSFSVSSNTLMKFFSLHYILPLLIGGIVIVHIGLLHLDKSTSPFGLCSNVDNVPFYPFYLHKDLIGILFWITAISFLIAWDPNWLSDPDNYVLANEVITPAHIVPEWYFLFFYAVLRSVPDKIFGIVLLAFSLFSLFLLPFLDFSSVQSPNMRVIYTPTLFFFFITIAVISWFGAQPMSERYVYWSQIFVLLFFIYIYAIIPFINCIESKVVEYVGIEEENDYDIFKRIKIDDDYSIDLQFGELVDNKTFNIVPRSSIPQHWAKTETTLKVVDGYKYALEHRLSTRNRCQSPVEYQRYITFCEGINKVRKVKVGDRVFFLIDELDFNDPRDWVVVEFYFRQQFKEFFGSVGVWLYPAVILSFLCWMDSLGYLEVIADNIEYVVYKIKRWFRELFKR